MPAGEFKNKKQKHVAWRRIRSRKGDTLDIMYILTNVWFTLKTGLGFSFKIWLLCPTVLFSVAGITVITCLQRAPRHSRCPWQDECPTSNMLKIAELTAKHTHHQYTVTRRIKRQRCQPHYFCTTSPQAAGFQQIFSPAPSLNPTPPQHRSLLVPKPWQVGPITATHVFSFKCSASTLDC